MAPPNPYSKSIAAGVPASSSSTKKSKSKSESKIVSIKVPENSILKAEIKSLGGDDEDYEMLAGIDSDESEIEGEPIKRLSSSKSKSTLEPVDASLSKDIRSLLKSLDFSAVGGNVDAEDEEEEVVEEGEEDDESSGTEDSEFSSEEDEVVEEVKEPIVVVKVKEVKEVIKEEKKESKYEREERRREARDIEKAEAKLESAAVREGRSVGKPIILKSAWIVDPTPQWYSVPIPTLPASATRPSTYLITLLNSQATKLLERENALYATSLAPRAPASAPPPPNGLSKADQVFIQQILTSGTSSDKISALLLLVSSSPLHTTAYLTQIANICQKKSREESGRAVRGVVEWWRGGGGDGGGCPSRKLRAFADQPGLQAVSDAWNSLEATGKGREKKEAESSLTRAELERILVVWAFEDWLKKWFFEILKALEQMSVDPLPHPRNLAVVHLSNLLRDKPEQEGNILRLLVNKLGDSQKAIASKTSHHLLQILQTHPGMTPIMVREVSSLILRPAQVAAPTTHVRFGKDKDAKKEKADSGQDHARYYGVITLNQVMLTRNQSEVAGKMIEVYFEIFGDLLGRVLEDTNEEDGPGFAERLEEEFEIKKKLGGGEKRKFGGGAGGKGKKGEEDKKDGEVNETDSKLVAAVLTGVNRAFPFAKIDDEAFKKRLDVLFRITHTGTFNVSIQALMLIYHVSAAKRAVSDRFYRALYSSLYDPRLSGSSKQALYLNLVFKAMKQDPDANRVMALIKRLVQVMLGMEVTFILGSIWIVGELMATVPGMRKMITEAEDLATATANILASKSAEGSSSSRHDNVAYDGKKREPQFANAQNSCLWELVPLLNHYHPSVALHANQLLSGTPISASTDLEQHSLNHFLDRFVYREVKKNAPTKGSSMMQSGVVGQDTTGRISMKKGPARGEDSLVNSDMFKNKESGDVPVDQLFFHKYFTTKTNQTENKVNANKKRKPRKGQDSDSDEESIADLGFSDKEDDDEDTLPPPPTADDDEEDDEAEEEIWKAMKASMPKRSGDDDEEDDMSDDDEGNPDDSDDEDMAQFDYTDSEAGEERGEGGEDDVPFKSAFGNEEDQFDEDDDDGDNLIEDDDDLIGSDEDMPMFGDEEEEDEDPSRKKKKRKTGAGGIFASAEDYAHMLNSDSDGEGPDEEL